MGPSAPAVVGGLCTCNINDPGSVCICNASLNNTSLHQQYLSSFQHDCIWHRRCVIQWIGMLLNQRLAWRRLASNDGHSLVGRRHRHQCMCKHHSSRQVCAAISSAGWLHTRGAKINGVPFVSLIGSLLFPALSRTVCGRVEYASFVPNRRDWRFHCRTCPLLNVLGIVSHDMSFLAPSFINRFVHDCLQPLQENPQGPRGFLLVLQ